MILLTILGFGVTCIVVAFVDHYRVSTLDHYDPTCWTSHKSLARTFLEFGIEVIDLVVDLYL